MSETTSILTKFIIWMHIKFKPGNHALFHSAIGSLHSLHPALGSLNQRLPTCYFSYHIFSVFEDFYDFLSPGVLKTCLRPEEEDII